MSEPHLQNQVLVWFLRMFISFGDPINPWNNSKVLIPGLKLVEIMKQYLSSAPEMDIHYSGGDFWGGWKLISTNKASYSSHARMATHISEHQKTNHHLMKEVKAHKTQLYLSLLYALILIPVVSNWYKTYWYQCKK